jgi:cellulose synthase/poly-beta-1,6-N-acetylglucosamine synthase-like glycosyltransferase
MPLEQAPAKAGATGRLRPTVSVVINTFNDAEFLPDALDSVLAQTDPPDEIIVVDDGSSKDPGPLVAARYPGVRFLRQENQGLAAARNTGLNAARSEMIVFLDADDKLLPAALESGLDCFAQAPACGFVFGGHRRIDKEGEPIGPDRYSPIGQDPFPAFYVETWWGCMRPSCTIGSACSRPARSTQTCAGARITMSTCGCRAVMGWRPIPK